MTRSRRPGWSLGLLSLASLLLGLISTEVVVRILGIDRSLMLKAIPFQAADLPVHQRSADLFLHYELKPGARYRGQFAGQAPYFVSIDEFGARFPTHRLEKEPGVFRILAFGGSTLYGAAVDDDETMAAALERSLNGKSTAGRRFEVWNFGISAYTLGQAAHLARLKLPVLSPDLILVLEHNRGRRAFLMPEDNRPEHYPYELIVADPDVFQEVLFAPRFVPSEMHLAAMANSAAYRASVVAVHLSLSLHRDEYCAKLNSDEARLLTKEAAARGVPVVYFAIPASRGAFGPESIFPELPELSYIDLYRAGADPTFYEAHPPAPVLAQFATLLMQELERRRFLRIDREPPRLNPEWRTSRG